MSAPEGPKQQLAALGLFPKRHFGQNFLADEQLARRIAALCTPRPNLGVTEIGAGLGSLTAPLLERAGKLVAIERDRELVPALAQRFRAELETGRLVILEADAKSVDLLEPLSGSDELVVCGNLPYQISGPLLEKLCRLAPRLALAVVLLQLEVAVRLAAAPGTAAYGALSVFVQAQYEVVRHFIVRRGAFYPQPRVDSAVVGLTPRRPALAEETPRFVELVHRAFQQRRKQLRNAWRGIGGVSPERLENAAHAAGIDLDERGERLGVTQFWRMTEELGQP